MTGVVMVYGNVLCVGSHPVDLNDGRVLGRGEHALSVDLDNPHNASQIAAGHLKVIDTAPVSSPRNRNGEPNIVAPAPTTVKEVIENV